MIAGLFHPGSGIGNQLFRYVATRVLALDKGYDFSMIGVNNFKCKSFMDVDMGMPNNILYDIEHPAGKIVPVTPVWEEKTNYYNPEFNFIEDNTIIDGEFQSIQYFGHRMYEVNEWLRVEPIEIPDDVCVIGFRGGEFYVFPELGLPKEYFEEAMAKMRVINKDMKFQVHTDDPVLASKFFPDCEIIQNAEINWRSMRYARYAIIANSSFYILPRLLKQYYYVSDMEIENKYEKLKSQNLEPITIAPRYWARRNTKEWSRPDNYYRHFIYI